MLKSIRRLMPMLALLGMLTSCTWLDNLGFDTYDYKGETVTITHNGDSETAQGLLPLLDILITDGVTLPVFNSTGDAISLYRDAVLRHMLETEYGRYSGNTALIEKAAKAYPELQITQIIPADDFEATMYEHFGGDVKINHKDGAVFKYLKKVEGYICNMVPKASGVVAEILSVDETDKTYRIHFRCRLEAELSEEYVALVIKRDDGTLYFKQLNYYTDN